MERKKIIMRRKKTFKAMQLLEKKTYNSGYFIMKCKAEAI